MRRCERADTDCAITTTHGTTAANPRIAHIPTDHRQPTACATGRATSGGTAVLTDIATEYDAVTVPIRSGKYRLTSGGSSTLPIPRPPSAITDHPMNAGALPARARSELARSSRAAARGSSVGSSPSRRATGVASEPNTRERRDGHGAEQPHLRVAHREVLADHLDDRRDGRHGDAQVEADEHDAGQHDEAAAPGGGRRHEGLHEKELLIRAVRRPESSAPGSGVCPTAGVDCTACLGTEPNRMVRRTGLIDTAVDELRGRIETEQWPVGTRIPPEPALVDLLGVGRNTASRRSISAMDVERISTRMLADSGIEFTDVPPRITPTLNVVFGETGTGVSVNA